MVENWVNWAGNQRAVATAVRRPASTDEVAAAVREAAGGHRTVKPVGSGHSFTAAAATDGVRLELDQLAGLVGVAGRQVTVQAGIRLRALNLVLAEHGLALPNLGDVDTQTLAGALATGTHGTGARYGCLASFVTGMTVVTGDGSVLRCDANTEPELFAAARVGVGAVGVVTELTLSCVDAFSLRAQERPERL